MKTLCEGLFWFLLIFFRGMPLILLIKSTWLHFRFLFFARNLSLFFSHKSHFCFKFDSFSWNFTVSIQIWPFSCEFDYFCSKYDRVGQNLTVSPQKIVFALSGSRLQALFTTIVQRARTKWNSGLGIPTSLPMLMFPTTIVALYLVTESKGWLVQKDSLVAFVSYLLEKDSSSRVFAQRMSSTISTLISGFMERRMASLFSEARKIAWCILTKIPSNGGCNPWEIHWNTFRPFRGCPRTFRLAHIIGRSVRMTPCASWGKAKFSSSPCHNAFLISTLAIMGIALILGTVNYLFLIGKDL